MNSFTMSDLEGFIPADVDHSKEEHLLNLKQGEGHSKLPLKPTKNKDKWEIAYASAVEEPNNIEKWNELFDLLDEKWEQLQPTERSEAFKTSVSSSYAKLLLRFPYLTEHWKRYLIVQYKMNGIDESLNTLRHSTRRNPQSVSLWVDFLSAMLAVHESKPENEKETHLKDIRKEFKSAEQFIGLNYNSDPFWNKYIEFETKYATEEPSLSLLELYKRLISIPLYQYAQYYNQFCQISKNYSVEHVVKDEQMLQQFLTLYSKSLVKDLSIVEQHQIIDAYAYSVFVETQKKVNEKWAFESLVTLQEFLLRDISEIQKQYESWEKYADYEIACLQSISDEKRGFQFQLVSSVFERALVPHCFNANLWLKYIKFLEDNTSDPTERFSSVKAVYDKAIFEFVPLDESNIREQFVLFLMSNEKFDLCNEFLLDCIRLFSGITGSGIYAKKAYIHEVRLILQLWEDNVDISELLILLEGIISGYFERIDRYKKEVDASPTQKQEKSKYEFKSSYSTALSRFLNDDGICIITAHYLRLLPDSDKIRNFFNKYHREEPLSRSVQFWKFFIEFEGYKEHNLINLRTIFSFIKTKSSLPKQAVDAFVDIYYDIICANMAEALCLRSRDDFLDILINRDIEKSDDLVVNVSARKRLARNNYMLRDAGDPRGKANLQHLLKEEELMNMRLKHLDHPGIFVDAAPEFTNSMFDRKEWVSLLDTNLTAPPLPQTKNVEKANANIRYSDE